MCITVETRLACGHQEFYPITCETAINTASNALIADIDMVRCRIPRTKLAWSPACCEPCFQDFFDNMKDGACIMCRDWMNIRFQREINRMFERGLDRDVERFEMPSPQNN